MVFFFVGDHTFRDGASHFSGVNEFNCHAPAPAIINKVAPTPISNLWACHILKAVDSEYIYFQWKSLHFRKVVWRSLRSY